MKRNKLMILATVALAGVMACGPIARAQDAATNTPPPGATPPRGPRGGGRGFQAIFEKLDLTAEQKEKIKPIMDDQREKMMALRDDSSLSPEDRRDKMKAIFEATDAKLKDILTADQFTKYQELRKQMMSRRGGPNGGNPPPPANPDNK